LPNLHSFPTRRSSDLQTSPFKTITKAMTVATSGSTVQVAPGIYDTLNNNETFPIVVPAGVLLIAESEVNKDAGSSTIFGGGSAPDRKSTRLNSSHVKI